MRIAFMTTALLAALTCAVSAAATPAPGGAMQRSSVEGCVGTQLFDGIWRLKVISVDPAASYNDGTASTGVGIKLQVRNGTKQQLAPDETGFSDISGHGIDLAYQDDNSVNLANAGGYTANLLDKKLPPGASSTITLYFPYGSDKTASPAKLLIAVDPHSPNNTKHVKYSTASPSFRIRLNCGKGAVAPLPPPT